MQASSHYEGPIAHQKTRGMRLVVPIALLIVLVSSFTMPTSNFMQVVDLLVMYSIVMVPTAGAMLFVARHYCRRDNAVITEMRRNPASLKWSVDADTHNRIIREDTKRSAFSSFVSVCEILPVIALMRLATGRGFGDLQDYLMSLLVAIPVILIFFASWELVSRSALRRQKCEVLVGEEAIYYTGCFAHPLPHVFKVSPGRGASLELRKAFGRTSLFELAKAFGRTSVVVRLPLHPDLAPKIPTILAELGEGPTMLTELIDALRPVLADQGPSAQGQVL